MVETFNEKTERLKKEMEGKEDAYHQFRNALNKDKSKETIEGIKSAIRLLNYSYTGEAFYLKARHEYLEHIMTY